jgi:hypothetical protein
MAQKKFRVLEVVLRLRYKVFEDYLYHLKTTYHELISKHCKVIKAKPIEFLKNMVAKGVEIDVSTKYRDIDEEEIVTKPMPCKCGSSRISIVLDTNEMGRECYRYNGKYWIEESPAPFVVTCACGRRGQVAYNYEEVVRKWNELLKET